MNFVKDGLISSEEFLNSYNSLVDTGVITIAGTPTPTMPKQEPNESCQAYRSRLESLGWHVHWVNDCPTPEPDESQVNYPMVTQNANSL